MTSSSEKYLDPKRNWRQLCNSLDLAKDYIVELCEKAEASEDGASIPDMSADIATIIGMLVSANKCAVRNETLHALERADAQSKL